MLGLVLLTVASVVCSVFTVPVHNAAHLDSNAIDARAPVDVLRQILEDLRIRMPLGVPEMGIPILDPYQQERLDFNIDNDLGKLFGSLTDLNVDGLQEFIVNELDINIVAFPYLFDITIPQLNTSGNYVVDGSMGGLIPMFGEGPFEANFEEIHFRADGRLRFINDTWFVSEMYLQCTIGKMWTHFRGLHSSIEYEEFFNQMMTDIGHEIFELVFPQMEPEIVVTLTEAIEGILSDVPLEDLIMILMGTQPVFPPLERDSR